MDKETKTVLTAAGVIGFLLYLDNRAWGKAFDSSKPVIKTPPFVSEADFIKLYYPLAVKYSAGSKIPPLVTMAQALIESAHGTSDLFVYHDNAFGVKGSAGDGRATGSHQGFRTYDSIEDSFADHADLLAGDNRYAAAFDPLNNDPVNFAQAIAPIYEPANPNYADQLIKYMAVISKYVS